MVSLNSTWMNVAACGCHQLENVLKCESEQMPTYSCDAGSMSMSYKSLDSQDVFLNKNNMVQYIHTDMVS